MAKLINVQYKTYTVVPNSVLKDKNLSIKQRGLLVTLLGLPDQWEFSIPGLCALTSDGKESIRNCLTELEKLGYLERIPVKNEKGQFDGYDYRISIPPVVTET